VTIGHVLPDWEIFPGKALSGAFFSFPGEFLEERPAGAAPLASRYLGKLQITGKKQHSADSFAPWKIIWKGVTSWNLRK
jgi:hypothetical protein